MSSQSNRVARDTCGANDKSADPRAHDLCVCGHERQLHGRNPDGTLGLCIRDEWCLCPGYQPAEHECDWVDAIERPDVVGKVCSICEAPRDCSGNFDDNY